MTKCKLCIPSECFPCFLYVVHDSISVTSKIGMSRRPVRRYGQYRKTVGKHVELVGYISSGCEMVTLRKEAKAIAAMERTFERSNGDWFFAPAETVMQILERAAA